MRFELTNVTIRKTQLFLTELNQVITEKEIYKKKQKSCYPIFLIKTFFIMKLIKKYIQEKASWIALLSYIKIKKILY